MNLELMKKLFCPMCRSDLEWNIEEKNRHQLIKGRARCVKCGAVYPVEDSMAVFLPPKCQDMRIWERGERVSRARMEQSCLSGQSANAEQDMSSEQILKKISQVEDINTEISVDLYEKYMNTIGMRNTFAILNELCKQCVEQIEEEGIVLDFASGKCILAEEIINARKFELVISDINPIILNKSKNNLQKKGCLEQVSFIVCDIKKSPFQDKSIRTITTLLGLQNIIPCKGVLEEIGRIADKFLCISAFTAESIEANLQELCRYGIEEVWEKEKLEKKISQLGWYSREVYSVQDIAKAIKTEDVMTRYAVMKFPVTDTMMEYNLTEYIC